MARCRPDLHLTLARAGRHGRQRLFCFSLSDVTLGRCATSDNIASGRNAEPGQTAWQRLPRSLHPEGGLSHACRFRSARIKTVLWGGPRQCQAIKTNIGVAWLQNARQSPRRESCPGSLTVGYCSHMFKREIDSAGAVSKQRRKAVVVPFKCS